MYIFCDFFFFFLFPLADLADVRRYCSDRFPSVAVCGRPIRSLLFYLTRVKSVKLTSCVVKGSVYFVHQQVFGSGGGFTDVSTFLPHSYSENKYEVRKQVAEYFH